MNTPLYAPQDRAEWERRRHEWGEEQSNKAFIEQDRVIEATERTNIQLNARGFVPKNQAEQQKKRTFVEDGS